MRKGATSIQLSDSMPNVGICQQHAPASLDVAIKLKTEVPHDLCLKRTRASSQNIGKMSLTKPFTISESILHSGRIFFFQLRKTSRLWVLKPDTVILQSLLYTR